MLKAGRKITLQSEELHVNNGYMLAPVIEINNIVLRADKPTPSAIKEFLEDHGAKVNRVRYLGDMLVRLRGEFSLHATNISEFASEHPQEMTEQAQDLEQCAVSDVLSEELHNDMFEPRGSEPFCYGHWTPNSELLRNFFSIHRFNIRTGTDANFTCFSYTTHQGIAAGRDINITGTGGCHTFLGKTGYIETDQFGYMTNIMAKNNINITGTQQKIDNTLMFAGSNISLTCSLSSKNQDAEPKLNSNLHIGINSAVEWVNLPHADQFVPKYQHALKLVKLPEYVASQIRTQKALRH